MPRKPRLITLKEARERFNISKTTMARLVKEGRFTIYENPIDGRQKLVEEREITRVVEPRLAQQLERAGGDTPHEAATEKSDTA